MKRRISFLFLVFLGISFPSHSQDVLPSNSQEIPWDQKIHRLEFIDFNPVTHLVEWGISEGSVNEFGDFIASNQAIATFSMNLSTGEMTHEGKSVSMSQMDAADAFRVFLALSQLMQNYTQDLEGSPAPVQHDAPEADSATDKSNPFGLALVASPRGRTLTRRRIHAGGFQPGSRTVSL